MEDKISIVVPVLINSPQLFKMTKEMLDGLFFNTKGVQECEVILVNDGSDAKYIGFLKKFFPNLIIMHNETNQGFAKAVNNGIRNATGDKIVLLNNDVYIKNATWLGDLIAGMDDGGYDIVAPKKSILTSSYEYIPDKDRYKYDEEKCFSYTVGWCVAIRRKVFEKIGLFPTDFGIGFWEDVAWHHAAKSANFKIFIVDKINNTKIQHLEHQTFRSTGININEQYTKNREIFLKYINDKIKLDFPPMK